MKETKIMNHIAFLLMGLGSAVFVQSTAVCQDAALVGDQATQGVAPSQNPQSPPRDRDILWKVVDNCFENHKSDADYCVKCPKPLPDLLESCKKNMTHVKKWNEVAVCKNTTDVWGYAPNFVSMKDQKMCGCSDGNFIHGLVLPRKKVTGVEDSENLPEDAWEYAWKVATKAS